MGEAIDNAILAEAADWILVFQSGSISARQREAFEHWRTRSAAHAEAWQRAESLIQTFDTIPEGIGSEALGDVSRVARRRALRGLLSLAVAAPAAWYVSLLVRDHWHDTAMTVRGERRTMSLPDGTRVVLNTGSAIDVRFTRWQRQITLSSGEILVESGHDAGRNDRPLNVRTAHGSMRALGTRFSVRLLEHATRLAVFEHAVELSPAQGKVEIVRQRHQATFTEKGMLAVSTVDDSDALWERGMLLLQNHRLADVVAELGRYSNAVLRCDAAVAELRVSGALALDDIDRALSMLGRMLPVRVESLGPHERLIIPALKKVTRD